MLCINETFLIGYLYHMVYSNPSLISVFPGKIIFLFNYNFFGMKNVLFKSWDNFPMLNILKFDSFFFRPIPSTSSSVIYMSIPLKDNLQVIVKLSFHNCNDVLEKSLDHKINSLSFFKCALCTNKCRFLSNICSRVCNSNYNLIIFF